MTRSRIKLNIFRLILMEKVKLVGLFIYFLFPVFLLHCFILLVCFVGLFDWFSIHWSLWFQLSCCVLERQSYHKHYGRYKILFEPGGFDFSLIERVNLEARGYGTMLVNISLLDYSNCVYIIFVD